MTHTLLLPAAPRPERSPRRSLALSLMGTLIGVAASSLPVQAQTTSFPVSASGSVDAPHDASSTNAADSSQSLQLHSGSQQVLRPGYGISRIAVGNPELLDVQVLRQTPGGNSDIAELLMTAKNPGRTTLTVWPRGKAAPQYWQVQVLAHNLILERRLTSLSEHAQATASLRTQAAEGTQLQDRSRIEVKSNTVQVDVQVVEFKKTALKRAGINIASLGANDQGFNFGLYNPSTGTGQSPIADAMNLVMGFGNAFSGAGLDVRLSVLEGNGLARVLAKPTLLAHSGQSASFLAGGELPIPVSANDGNIAIEYKEFGVRLQLTPTILSDERIALKIAPEASDLDFTNSVSVGGVSVPAIRTRRADTMVELADGESFVIGGLVSRNTASNVNKVPLLGDLPILGAFFKNLTYSQEETELVIIVTPTLVNPLPPGTNFEPLLPGAQSERRNAAQVWEPFLAGGLKPDAALPGFSY